jgi:hypothetical protein
MVWWRIGHFEDFEGAEDAHEAEDEFFACVDLIG